MRILMATAEMAPYSKTGGLGDVLGALPAALARQGHEVWVATPMYGSVQRGKHGVPPSGEPFHVYVGGQRHNGQFVHMHPEERLHIIGVDNLEYFGLRDGIYGDKHGGFGDNGARFAFFCRAVVELLHRLVAMGQAPDVIHGHDWHTGLLHAFLGEGQGPGGRARRPAMVFTIHNLAYQGVYWPDDIVPLAGLPWSVMDVLKMEFRGNCSLMKGGLSYADVITTVSPTYAREIQTEEHGYGLHGLLRDRAYDLFGILNGVDTDVWNPGSDPHIAAPFSLDDLSGKATCKAALQREFGLPQRPDVPLLGIVSRMTAQKGLSLVGEIMQGLLRNDVQLVVLGTGDRGLQEMFRAAERARPDKVSLALAFDEGLAHRIEAGSDIFLMPSLFEPCGLNQMYSLRYGTVPVVRAVGGLNDTVLDFDPQLGRGTGFKFDTFDGGGLWWALSRALDIYWNNRGLWRHIQRQGMEEDFSWARSARAYGWLFEEAVRRYHDRFQG